MCPGAELIGCCDAPGSCTHGWRAWACRAIASTGTIGTITFIGTTGTRAAAYARAATRRRMHPRRPPLVGPCVVFGSGAVCDCGRSAQTWMACLCCSVACVAACAGSTRPGCFQREGSAGLRLPLAGTVHQSDAVHVLRALNGMRWCKRVGQKHMCFSSCIWQCVQCVVLLLYCWRLVITDMVLGSRRTCNSMVASCCCALDQLSNLPYAFCACITMCARTTVRQAVM